MWLFLWFYIMVLLITNYKLMLEMHDVISEFLLQALYLRNGTKEQAVEQVRAEIEATYKEQLEQLQKQVNAFQLEKKNSQLVGELEKAGAVDSTALIKLIGETDDVVKSVNELKTKHPSLFKSVQIPETQRSAEGFTSAGYAEELQSARNKYLKTGDRSEIDAVNKKYGVKTF
jgi:hypothetical protein